MESTSLLAHSSLHGNIRNTKCILSLSSLSKRAREVIYWKSCLHPYTTDSNKSTYIFRTHLVFHWMILRCIWLE